jgi:hypothetical protein
VCIYTACCCKQDSVWTDYIVVCVTHTHTHDNIYSRQYLIFFFLNLRKPHFFKNILCKSRWGRKTPAVSGFYKRCTPWLELETCYTDLKSFVITDNNTKFNLFRQHAVANKISDQFDTYLWLDVVMIAHALILFKLTAAYYFLWKMRYV